MATMKKNRNRKSAGHNMEKLEPYHAVGGTTKWYSCYGKQHDGSSKT